MSNTPSLKTKRISNKTNKITIPDSLKINMKTKIIEKNTMKTASIQTQ